MNEGNYREDEDMSLDEMYGKTIPLSEYEAMKRRIADLETQSRSAQQMLFGHGDDYPIDLGLLALTELRLAQLSGLTERVFAAERQRDDLAAALRPFAAIGEVFRNRPSLGGYGVDLLEANREDWIRAADALKRLEGEVAKDESQSDAAGQE